MKKIAVAVTTLFAWSVLFVTAPSRAVAQPASASCLAPLSSSTPTKSVFMPNVTKTLGGLTGWQTPFIVQNTGSATADLEVSFYAFGDGSCVTRRIVPGLKPGTSYADVPNNDLDLPDGGQFSVVVRSFGASAVGVVNEHAGTGAGAEAMSYDAFNSGATSVFLPNITRRFNGFHTPFIIQNLGDRQATIGARFISFDGSAPEVNVTRTIDPGRSQFIEPNVEPTLVDGKQYSVTVRETEASCPVPSCAARVPLAVVVNAHNDDPGTMAPVAYATDGIAQGASTVFGPYAAKNAAGVGRVSTIVVQNVGAASVIPTLTFTPLTGTAAQVQTFASPSTVQPGGAWAFDPRFTSGTTTPCTGASATCLGDGEYSFVANAATGSIAVTVNVISPMTAMGYSGSPVAAGRFFLPNVTRTLGGVDGWTTPILLQTVGASGATLKWYRFTDGSLVLTQTVAVAPGSGVRIDPRGVDGLADNTQYAVVAEGIGGTIAAIVTEFASGGDNAMIYEGFADPATIPAPSPSPSPSAAPSPTP